MCAVKHVFIWNVKEAFVKSLEPSNVSCLYFIATVDSNVGALLSTVYLS